MIAFSKLLLISIGCKKRIMAFILLNEIDSIQNECTSCVGKDVIANEAYNCSC